VRFYQRRRSAISEGQHSIIGPQRDPTPARETPMIYEPRPARISWVGPRTVTKRFPFRICARPCSVRRSGGTRWIPSGRNLRRQRGLEVVWFSGLALEAASCERTFTQCVVGSPRLQDAHCVAGSGMCWTTTGARAASLQGIANRLLHDGADCTMHLPGGSATLRIFSRAFITPILPARSAGRKIR